MQFHSSAKQFNAILPLLLILTFTTSWTFAANILFYFPFSTYSHRITAWPLVVKLAEQGHSVTFLQNVPNKNPHPNVTDMLPSGAEHPIPPNMVAMRMEKGKMLTPFLSFILPGVAADVCFQFLNNTENVQWINKAKFDLVVVDSFWSDCGHGLAWKWKAKTIIFTPTHFVEWFPDTFGFPDESASIPGIFLAQDMPLGFFQRVMSTLAFLIVPVTRHVQHLAVVEEYLKEKLNMPDMPNLSSLIKNTSLVFMNTHYSEELPRSLPPSFVSVGGMHVTGQVNPLPKEMEQFVKASGDTGFIFVSFGSEADLTKAPEHIKEIFFNALGKSKARFLWRWVGERPKEMPANVLTASWMPQQDILGHPKCRGFITHGGLLSMQEAVFHAVPMIVMPIFAEQDYNAERLHRTGRGVRLEITKLTEQQLADAIDQILTDPSLKQQMQLASTRFKDRPQSAVDTAVWYTNYILRHEDTSFMRPLAINLKWYQRRQLDVWGFLVISTLMLVYITAKVIILLLGRLFGKGKAIGSVVSNIKKKN